MYAPSLSTRILQTVLAACLVIPAAAQTPLQDPIKFHVQGPSQRLEMVANSSRILSLDKEVPRALVNNTAIVKVVPISPNQIQVSALKPGVTQINLWDEDGNVHSVDVLIFGDSRELEMLLQTQFPTSSIKVRQLASSVLLTGTVDRPDIVSRIVSMAEDYYPKVINNITVGGVQQVMLHVQVMEVSRTKLRSLGFDWAQFGQSGFVVQDVSGLIGTFSNASQSVTGTGGATVNFGVFSGGDAFFGLLEALRENNLVKVLAEPTVVTVSGRPASFLSGGEFPILVPQSLGTVSIEYKQFGTRVDFVPIVLGNGRIRLEVRPQVSEIDNARGVTVNGERIPGLRTRWVDTAVEMRSGQTLALAGLIQTRVESQNRGLPFLADLPWAGAAFRRVQEQMNEIELLVMVRPELVDALEPHEVPPCGPGETMTSPNDIDFHWRGYLEVPKCCTDGSCSQCQGGQMNESLPPGAMMEGEQPVPTDSIMPQGPEVPAPSESLPPVDSGIDAPTVPQAWTIPPGAPRVELVNHFASEVRPAAATTPVERLPNRYDANNPFQRRSSPVSKPAVPPKKPAALFGPVGYDVLDFKEGK